MYSTVAEVKSGLVDGFDLWVGRGRTSGIVRRPQPDADRRWLAVQRHSPADRNQLRRGADGVKETHRGGRPSSTSSSNATASPLCLPPPPLSHQRTPAVSASAGAAPSLHSFPLPLLLSLLSLHGQSSLHPREWQWQWPRGQPLAAATGPGGVCGCGGLC